MSQPTNIGPRGARRRAVPGAVALIAAAALGVGMVLGIVAAAWMAPYVLLLWLGGLGVFQARAKT